MARLTNYLEISVLRHIVPYNLEEDFIKGRWNPPRVDADDEVWCCTLRHTLLWRV